jgi:hypothetical protein
MSEEREDDMLSSTGNSSDLGYKRLAETITLP